MLYLTCVDVMDNHRSALARDIIRQTIQLTYHDANCIGMPSSEGNKG